MASLHFILNLQFISEVPGGQAKEGRPDPGVQGTHLEEDSDLRDCEAKKNFWSMTIQQSQSMLSRMVWTGEHHDSLGAARKVRSFLDQEKGCPMFVLM